MHIEEGTLRLASARDLGSYVRERRRKLDLTQAQLATSARVSRRWLSDLEAGKESADLALVLRTMHALGLVLDAVPEEETGTIDLDAHLDQYLSRARNPEPMAGGATSGENVVAKP